MNPSLTVTTGRMVATNATACGQAAEFLPIKPPRRFGGRAWDFVKHATVQDVLTPKRIATPWSLPLETVGESSDKMVNPSSSTTNACGVCAQCHAELIAEPDIGFNPQALNAFRRSIFARSAT